MIAPLLVLVGASAITHDGGPSFLNSPSNALLFGPALAGFGIGACAIVGGIVAKERNVRIIGFALWVGILSGALMLAAALVISLPFLMCKNALCDGG